VYCANHSKAAINEPPGNRNVPDMSCDEGERDDTPARNQTEGNDPLITDWINVRTNERNGDDL
jgi:hypothetical protein